MRCFWKTWNLCMLFVCRTWSSSPVQDSSSFRVENLRANHYIMTSLMIFLNSHYLSLWKCKWTLRRNSTYECDRNDNPLKFILLKRVFWRWCFTWYQTEWHHASCRVMHWLTSPEWRTSRWGRKKMNPVNSSTPRKLQTQKRRNSKNKGNEI